eukprot:jgi/Botrbrau1/8145/Bobra.0308s0035.2
MSILPNDYGLRQAWSNPLVLNCCADPEKRADPEHQSWLEKFVGGGGSSLALAFICNKALFPVRAPVTIGLTPLAARLLRNRRAAALGGIAPAVGSSDRRQGTSQDTLKE